MIQYHIYNKVHNCVASLQKGPDVAKKKIIEIFADLNRAGHDKSVKKIN